MDLESDIIVKGGKKFKVIKTKKGRKTLMQIHRHLNGSEFILAEVFEWDPDFDEAVQNANKFMEEIRSNGYNARRFTVYGVEGVYICKK